MKKVFVFFSLLLLLVMFFSVVLEMPPYGNINNPANKEVAEYYLRETLEDTRVTNVVAAIITDYRAFDTLGETTVLFLSIAAVLSVLVGKKKEEEEKK